MSLIFARDDQGVEEAARSPRAASLRRATTFFRVAMPCSDRSAALFVRQILPRRRGIALKRS